MFCGRKSLIVITRLKRRWVLFNNGFRIDGKFFAINYHWESLCVARELFGCYKCNAKNFKIKKKTKISPPATSLISIYKLLFSFKNSSLCEEAIKLFVRGMTIIQLVQTKLLVFIGCLGIFVVFLKEVPIISSRYVCDAA